MEHRKINKNEHRGKKGIGAIIFSRTFVFFAMLVVQLAIYSVVVYYASNTRITFIIIFVLAFLLIVHIVNDGSDPNMKIIWIIMLILTPTLGVLMYLYVRFEPLSIILKKRLKKQSPKKLKSLQKRRKKKSLRKQLKRKKLQRKRKQKRRLRKKKKKNLKKLKKLLQNLLRKKHQLQLKKPKKKRKRK